MMLLADLPNINYAHITAYIFKTSKKTTVV